MKKLEGLKWSPHWVSHLGCVKGCLDYLGIDISPAWLFVGTGHAFALNIHPELCPSGPTAWRYAMLFALAPNLGYRHEGLHGSKYQEDLKDLQKRAWDHIRGAIDSGSPCYGWELGIAEFYVIQGYDDTGYYFSGPGCDEGKGPKSWDEIADTGIGMLEMYSIHQAQPADPAHTIKEAFKAVLKQAANTEKWALPNYTTGLQGYDSWIKAMEAGKADRFGLGYNAAVWAECRQYAVDFLKEGAAHVDDPIKSLLEEAREHYEVVAKNMANVVDLYPFAFRPVEEYTKVDERSAEAVEALYAARGAEERGLELLEKIAAL